MVFGIIALLLVGVLTYTILVVSARTKDQAQEDQEQMEFLRQYHKNKKFPMS